VSPTPNAQQAATPVVVHRQVNLFDLQRQKARIGAEIETRIDTVLDHGQFILGPEVSALEESLAAFAGVKHAIGVSSGRDAIIMMLMAIDAGPGDAVFVPAFTFSATAGTVVSVGASPVFVDVDPRTFNMDLTSLEAAIAKVKAEGKLNLKAIMPVDLYGLPADYYAIGQIAEKHGMQLVSDAAQSFGGETCSQRVLADLRRSRRRASTRPSRWAVMAMAVRCSPMMTIWQRRCAKCATMAGPAMGMTRCGWA
jgi:UDP-2-acetamido-2-deoxy-ribo-hexuluronate aminotransferase